MGYLVAEVVDSGQRREHPTSPPLFHFSFLSFFFLFPFFLSFHYVFGSKTGTEEKGIRRTSPPTCRRIFSFPLISFSLSFFFTLSNFFSVFWLERVKEGQDKVEVLVFYFFFLFFSRAQHFALEKERKEGNAKGKGQVKGKGKGKGREGIGFFLVGDGFEI
ncbi:hypothetical protein F5X96DRAFT_652113 [Biscogniauxia mediterranea]|nr:hypothetical protein F5X96DRAFT_652113 [Biscogniauxia mediterranea]